MKVVLSGPSGGRSEADGSEVESKQVPTETVPRCARWTDEKHKLYLSSLEKSFVNQLNSSQFYLHWRNLLGRSRANQRRSDSSITTESPSDISQVEELQQGCRDDLKFATTISGVQKENTSFSVSENQWVRHFAPKSVGKGVNIRTNCQAVYQQSSYSSKSVKRERACYSMESTSQAQSSCSSQDCIGYGEGSDQNFINEEIIEEELSQTRKNRRLKSVTRSLIDQEHAH